jgi:hypothetical protein
MVSIGEHFIVPLQTKNHYAAKSELQLVKRSLQEFAIIEKEWDGFWQNWIISMAYPGIGLGGLTKAEVQPLLEKHLGFLGDRLRVYDLGAK